MVIDTSIILAIYFNEKHASWAEQQLMEYETTLRMSTVNLAESLILLKSKQPHFYEKLADELLSSTIRFVPPTIRQAELASHARLNFPINLGDCFAYALAKDEGCSILTLDRDFLKTDAEIICK